MKKRSKKYIPKKKYNPVVLSKEIEVLREKIIKNRQQHDLMFTALERHVEYLTNFTSHDIKNAIQNMDSVVSSVSLNEIKQEDLDTIKTCLNSIRLSLDNFAKLVPNSTHRNFFLKDLCRAAELINRSVFKKNKIIFEAIYDNNERRMICQPYHNLLQVLNNLILNSIKAIEISATNKKIRIESRIYEDEVEIMVCDTGCGIEEKIKEKVFDIYFSSTGGSGIGLYHTKYSLEKINGNIEISEKFDIYSTVFKIKFPLKNDTLNIDN